MATPKSELDWKLADYEGANVEPPERILADPTACEGELMTADEVQEFIHDSIGTIMVLLDRGSERFGAVRDNFIADLGCLHRMGKIADDEYNEIITSEELSTE